MSATRFTDTQGQSLAFIDAYTRVHGRPPAETDMQRHFRVSPPSVHQRVLTLERLAAHKAMFFAERDAARTSIGYSAAVSGGLKLVPEGAARDALADDYARMVED